MTVAPLGVLQTTTTTGTGTLTLIAAGSNARSFNGALGSSSIVTPYMIRFATGYELGVGVYDGGTPGTLTRPSVAVIMSSNAGSLVTLPAGTADVYIPNLPGLRGVRTGTGSDALSATVAGERYVWTGSSAQTLTLPPVSVFPPGVGLLVQNRGTAILTVDGSGAEAVNGVATIALYPGQSADLFVRSGAWDAAGTFGIPPIYKTGTGTMTAGVLSVTFATAFPNAILDASSEQSGAVAVGTFNGVALSALTTTGFTAYSVVGYGGAVRWRAWGY